MQAYIDDGRASFRIFDASNNNFADKPLLPMENMLLCLAG